MTKAIFFDRDGTLLVEMGYLADPGLVRPYAFTAEALRLARDRGFLLFAITNQSAVARGWLAEDDLEAIHARMQELLARESAALDAIYYCPHHENGTVAKYRRACDCRKPATALGREAIARFGVDPSRSFAVGDKLSDVRFGAALGLTPCLVRTGYGVEEEVKLREQGPGGVHVSGDVLEAVRWVGARDGSP